MCGVVGYVGTSLSRDHVMQGLARLEYRGYDSSGFACFDATTKTISCHKAVGKLDQLVTKLSQEPIDGAVGMGHTRWATHGVASLENTHPHFDCSNMLSIVHNGIVENHYELKQSLANTGHFFRSNTDTEVVAHAFEEALAHGLPLQDAVSSVLTMLQGAFALIVLSQDYPDHLIVVRKGAPLCVGIGDGEMFVASDMVAFAGKAKKVIFLPDETFAFVKKDGVELYNFSAQVLTPVINSIDIEWVDNGKNGFEHYMVKEIYEQKRAVQATVRSLSAVSSISRMGLSHEWIQQMTSLNIVACGTSWHAGLIGQFYAEKILGIPVAVSLGSEFRYREFFPSNQCLYLAISQSGETADTLESIRLIRESGLKTATLTNSVSSSMVRETDGFLLTSAGPEFAVASTKAFATQVAALYWFTHWLAYVKGLCTHDQLKCAEQELWEVAAILEESLVRYAGDIQTRYAPLYAQFKRFIFLGRGVTHPLALEAALKLKEISYIFAQGYPAGELKHGPIALIDQQTPVVIFSHADTLLYQKLLSNAQEVKARQGHLIVFAFEGQEELISLADTVFVFPKVAPLLGPLAMTGVMQFFAYAIAQELGLPIDKPRNLAKSVTVE